MFTPQQNFSLSNITLGITGFTDSTIPSNGGTLDLYLASDVNNTNPGSPIHEPGPTIASATAPISYSTGPLYSFDLSASLQADTSYWLWIYLQSPDGNDYVSASWNGIDALQGIAEANSVDVVIDGSEYGIDSFDPNSYTPFTAAPEPESYALLLGALVLAGFFRKQCQRVGIHSAVKGLKKN